MDATTTANITNIQLAAKMDTMRKNRIRACFPDIVPDAPGAKIDLNFAIYILICPTVYPHRWR
jgi:hypothetical protein